MLKTLINTLSNTELLLTSMSDEQWLLWAKDNKNKNIFFGVGIMTSKAISEFVPFDILAMFFIAELLRRVTNGEKVVVLIADQHAITNESVPLEKIRQVTKNTLGILQTIKKSFNLNHFEIIQTTPLNFDDGIKVIYRNLPDISNDYLKHEVADTLWLQKHHNVGIKLGWAMSVESEVQGHDERFFDAQIAEFTKDVSFIHTKPGRTADVKRQRVSPYVSIAGEDRLTLRTNENVIEKLNKWKQQKDNPAVKPLLRHISQVVRLHDRLFEPLTFMPLEDKVQTLINRSTK